ncbi:hypothetical protein B9J77_03030 [candidate division NPL-UPA2 bacterium Unc8]|uniref:Uncharacterized protein n=1 Tax=candidate division NPL-UPA2 bacterium Unc8 TaxID=1980939 RepID=A0A399FVQ3_UNCN2|nr:MAG: hypothetical protein B9J77_03030 [candidate division NPL-UPA2 bacterium Unc8]
MVHFKAEKVRKKMMKLVNKKGFTLIGETIVDDNIYLLGNSLWVFKLAKDVVLITFGKDLDTAKHFVNKNFPDKTRNHYYV